MNTGDVRVDKRAVEPTYLLTEGTRQDLLARGYAVSPFTSVLLVADVNDGKVSNIREVSQEEFDKVSREATDKAEQAEPKQTKSFAKASSARSEESELRKPAPKAEAPKPGIK